MSQAQTDRNLLFGVLAVQADLIDAAQFAEGCAVWASKKDVPLEDVLVERGWLTPADRADVQKLVDRKLRKHGGDAKVSLAEVTTDDVRRSLAGVADADVQESLAGPAPTPQAHVLLATTGYVPEARDRYTLSRLHATGGIGRVWLARDGSLGRDVALKELRPERVANPAVLGRFVQEAQITGQLEHPGIVPIYEVGKRPEDEAPFYTMRFIRGRSLSEAIKAFHQKRRAGEAGPLEQRELLHAFLGVCHAVAYAHSRGVIHRDLKGGNVVLGDFGEVIVLDWGLAKVLGAAESASPPLVLPTAEAHGETLQGQVLGTPAYMAPEQAEGRLDRINQRSDVYSLGAILYEVLTGQTPFAGSDTQEVLRHVIHDPPVRPRVLDPRVAPALEAVCLKALAKRPEDRYASATAVADEIRHWLADEPVSAWREPVPIRLARWGRRHKPWVASAAALAGAAIVALAVGTALLGQANVRTEQQRAEAQRQRDLANANFDKARQAVDDYFTEVSENKLLETPLPGMQPLRKELLESALKYYRDFAREHRDDRNLQVELARAQARVGRITEDVGTMPDAHKAYQESRTLWEQVVRDHPGEPAHERELAQCYVNLARVEFRYLAQPAEAKAWLDRALAIDERLAGDHPRDLAFQAGLARTYQAFSMWLESQGRPADEEVPYDQKAVNIWERIAPIDPKYESDLAGGLMNLGYAYTRTGSAARALQTHERARALLEKLVRDKPGDLLLRRELGRAYINLGYVHHYQTLQFQKGYAYYLQTIKIWGQLARENPSVNQYQYALASVQRQAADLLLHAGRPAEAVPLGESAVEILEKVDALDPANRKIRLDLILGYLLLGNTARAARHPDRGRQYFEKALAVAQKDAADQPDNTDSQRNLARCYESLGELAASTGKADDARAFVHQAIDVLEKHGARRPKTSVFFRRDLALYYQFLGKLEASSQHRSEALKAYTRSVDLQEETARNNPTNVRFQSSVIGALTELAEFHRSAGDFLAALQALQKARARAEHLGTLVGNNAGWQRNVANVDLRIGAVEHEAGHREQALQAFRRAITVLETLPTALDLYNLACARALCAAVIGGTTPAPAPAEQARQKEEADRAVAAFRAAVKAGFRDVQNARQDHDLDALRQRPDFQEALKELEATVGKQKSGPNQ
jgi:serine/threonine-protein kinase